MLAMKIAPYQIEIHDFRMTNHLVICGLAVPSMVLSDLFVVLNGLICIWSCMVFNGIVWPFCGLLRQNVDSI